MEEPLKKSNRPQYHRGIGSHVCSEALPNALPPNQNSPQVCPYGLYAEQLSGSAFTAPRAKNMRSWLYRIRPSVCHSAYKPYTHPSSILPISDFVIDPSQYRWDPLPLPERLAPANRMVDFVDGMVQVCGSGDPSTKHGLCIYNYTANVSMGQNLKRAFYNADGDMLIVPQVGTLEVTTEMGKLHADPCEVIVIPRGIKFAVDVEEPSRGYILEVLKGHFDLPNLGPIGANGLANPRDFEIPVAQFESEVDEQEHEVIAKFGGKFFSYDMDHSPFNVVAWHGNYYPFRYDLRLFNTMNSVSFDHPDPSIYTVLTVASDEEGTALADFVIFPPRWMVADHTFRPPYYHRNCMSEYMGMIYGKYDGKAAGSAAKGAFVPGGASLHSCMSAHGPDRAAFMGASHENPQVPRYFDGGLAFMFETSHLLKIHPLATGSTGHTKAGSERRHPQPQPAYSECWQTLPKIFDGTPNPTLPER